MNLNFKNRIAFYYLIATAIVTALAFGTIYFVVQETVWSNLDKDLSFEAKKHSSEIKILEDSIWFKNKIEWEEREHREVQVNPVFIQLNDQSGRIMDRSPNLKNDFLTLNESKFGGNFDSKVGNKAIRQVQLLIEQNGKIKGYILAAVSSESALSILLKLRNILFISYSIMLVGLYFISRFIAGRSILPVREVTKTITRITKQNLKERVVLPQYKDEIYELSTNFNALLDRIENALERERQFTSDASHELRTPLATLIGTLEVLIRKPRTQQEYENKIKYSLSEIEKMANTLEQLLLLARLNSNLTEKDTPNFPLSTILDDSLANFEKEIIKKDLKMEIQTDSNKQLLVPYYYSHLIIENVLSNAIKYSKNGSRIFVVVGEVENKAVCTIRDEGIGIKQDDLEHIYDSFFRSDSLDHKHIPGNGLGLSIAKKCTEALGATLNIESVLGRGTSVSIYF